MILVIDNYDSFTYNLVQYLGTIRPDIQVVRNDQVTLEEIEKWDPSHILLSPGPGYPEEAGICINVVKKFQGKIPILGICLGHQAICQAYGAVIAPAKELMHGKKSLVTLKSDCSLFAGLGVTIEAARYHSLAVKRDTLPDCLKITAQTEDGEVMAVVDYLRDRGLTYEKDGETVTVYADYSDHVFARSIYEVCVAALADPDNGLTDAGLSAVTGIVNAVEAVHGNGKEEE